MNVRVTKRRPAQLGTSCGTSGSCEERTEARVAVYEGGSIVPRFVQDYCRRHAVPVVEAAHVAGFDVHISAVPR